MLDRMIRAPKGVRTVMLKLALGSAPHRSLPARDFLSLARSAGAEGVAWCAGFAPPGEVRLAESLMLDTLRERLSTVAYEVDLRQIGEGAALSIELALASASALHAPLIVSPLPSLPSEPEARAKAVDGIRRAGDAASRKGVVLAFDPERRTRARGFLARGVQARASADALRFVREVQHPFVRLRWEPDRELGFDTLMEGLEALSGFVPQVAARAVGPDGGRAPLEERDEDWQMWLDCFERQAGLRNMSHYVVLYAEAADGGLGLRADAAYLRATLGRLTKARAETKTGG